MVPYFPDFIQNIDVTVLNWIHEVFSCAFLDAIVPMITFLGDKGWFWIAVAVILLFPKKTRKVGLMMGVALILGLAIGNGVLKNLFARVRPFDLEGAMVKELLIDRPHDFSFPSGHTLASFEAASVILLQRKNVGGLKVAIPALVLAIMISLSRLYLYVHFPSDILGGMLLGILFGFCGVGIVNLVEKKLFKK